MMPFTVTPCGVRASKRTQRGICCGFDEVYAMIHLLSRRHLLFLFTLVVLAGLPGRALALDLLSDTSKERAKELGITVTATQRQDDVWVQVELKSAKAVKDFKRTDLEVMHGGKKLVQTTLMPWKPAADTMRFEFYVDPAALSGCTVTVVIWDDPLTGVGHRLKMKDFVSLPAGR
jgi:hypothetical protein